MRRWICRHYIRRCGNLRSIIWKQSSNKSLFCYFMPGLTSIFAFLAVLKLIKSRYSIIFRKWRLHWIEGERGRGKGKGGGLGRKEKQCKGRRDKRPGGGGHLKFGVWYRLGVLKSKMTTVPRRKLASAKPSISLCWFSSLGCHSNSRLNVQGYSGTFYNEFKILGDGVFNCLFLSPLNNST